MHDWPAWVYRRPRACGAAVSRSASGSTITGVELPSSSADALARLALADAPADGGLPVKEIIGTSGWSTRAFRPTRRRRSRPSKNPSGSPASARVRASSSADRGVEEAGFSTTGQPAAIAGASLCATRLRGKLKGEIAPTTPTGSRRMTPELAGARGARLHRHHLAGQAAGLDGREGERVDAAGRLAARLLHGLPRLEADGPRERLGAVGNEAGRALQHLRAARRPAAVADGRPRPRRPRRRPRGPRPPPARSPPRCTG